MIQSKVSGMESMKENGGERDEENGCSGNCTGGHSRYCNHCGMYAGGAFRIVHMYGKKSGINNFQTILKRLANK